MAACELCGLSPAQGNSTVSDEAGVAHQFCHPLVNEGRRPLSCFEIIGYVMVENHPRGRRPPEPIPPLRQARARRLISDFKTSGHGR